MNTILKLAAAAALVAAPLAAHAARESVKAELTSSAETPPNGSKGTGTLTGTYDPSSRKLTYDVTYENLTGPATMAHFHAPAPMGKAAGVEVPIKGSVASPITGEVTLSETDAKNLTDGMTYFNVHTDKNPKGEIRGQVMVGK